MTRRSIAAAVSLAALVVLSACSDKGSEPFQDAPRGVSNTAPADTITMPDGFSNVATKCDHGNRLYVVFHGDSNYAGVTVVPNDPTCAKAG